MMDPKKLEITNSFKTKTESGIEARSVWATGLKSSRAAGAKARAISSFLVKDMFRASGHADSPAQKRTWQRDCPDRTPHTQIEQKEWWDDASGTEWGLKKNQIGGKNSNFQWFRNCECLRRKMAMSEKVILPPIFLGREYCNTTMATNIGQIETQRLYVAENNESERKTSMIFKTESGTQKLDVGIPKYKSDFEEKLNRLENGISQSQMNVRVPIKLAFSEQNLIF